MGNSMQRQIQFYSRLSTIANFHSAARGHARPESQLDEPSGDHTGQIASPSSLPFQKCATTR